MSYSLALKNGDLVMSGNSLQIVYGVEKLKQDIALWLGERFAIDRFHPTMGSTLQNFIGDIINNSTKSRIESEVLRVLSNYQAVQYRGLKENPQKYSLAEILYSIDAVDVSLSYDTVNVKIKLRNAEFNSTTLSVTQNV